MRILASVPGIERLSVPTYITGVLIQRLSVLISIEVLAGFFLRQYRIALEDFRYYETITRRREAALIAFLVHTDFHDDDKLHELAKELMRVPGFGVLKSGETTAILESSKTSQNEFSALLAPLFSLVTETKASVEKVANATLQRD